MLLILLSVLVMLGGGSYKSTNEHGLFFAAMSTPSVVNSYALDLYTGRVHPQNYNGKSAGFDTR